MTDPPPPPGPSQLFDVYIWLAQIAAMGKASYAGATTWLVYDLLLSSHDEVQLIWRSQNKVPKFLYFLSRYFGLFTVVCLSRTDFLPMYCKKRFIFQAVTYSVLSLSVQFGLMLRVHALWGRSRRVGLVLLIGFLASEAGMICMQALALPVVFSGLLDVGPGMPIQGCVITAFPSFYNLCWLPTLIFETLLFGMNLISCLTYRPLKQTPTVCRVLRDGSVYYASVCLILILITLGAYYPNTGLTEIAEPWLPATFSFSGAHLLLSIRKLAAARQKFVDLTTISTTFMVSPKPQDGTGDILELQRLDIPKARAHTDLEASPVSCSSRHTNGDDDVERAYPPKTPLSLRHDLKDVRARSGECVHLAAREAAESPVEALPPLSLEPGFGRDYIFGRLTRGWNLDWVQEWGHRPV